jgi:acyl-CoA synthetase (AMP-forming)/AMP-acid ligase II
MIRPARGGDRHAIMGLRDDSDGQSGPAPPWSGVTLTGLFRGSVRLGPARTAFVEGPAVPAGEARVVSFAAAFEAIEGLKLRLQGLGLSEGAVVGVLMPNSVEAAVAVLALLEAGISPLLMPLALPRDVVVAALERAGAKGLIIADDASDAQEAGRFVKVVRAQRGVRFVAAFGDKAPPGSVPLCGLDELQALGAVTSAGEAAPNVPDLLTVETLGPDPVILRHAQEALVATALGVVVTAATAPGTPVLTTLPPTTQAGLVTGLVPALIGGSALHVLRVFSGQGLMALLERAGRCQLVVPAMLERPLAGERLMGSARLSSTVLLHRAPARIEAAAAPAGAETPVLDALALGERGLVQAARSAAGEPRLVARAYRVPEAPDGFLVAMLSADARGRPVVAGPGMALPFAQQAPLPLTLTLGSDARVIALLPQVSSAARSA